MEPEEQIYVNIEELQGDTCSLKHYRPADSETRPVRAPHREQTPLRLSTVCLAVLCFLLLTAVLTVSVLYDRDVKQLYADLTNHTAVRHQLLVQNQNLTDERDLLQTSLSNLTKTVGSCPEGWRRFGCSCYFISTVVSSWSSSKRTCRDLGADLVRINSQREMEFLNLIGRGLKFWIGLSCSPMSSWSWTDGSTLQTGYWRNRYTSIPTDFIKESAMCSL
ncbi:C-type lectin domain family 7 member A-like [Notolabrus celidotus]|uniref:C-type lectin domain family 7 member A-like n=1 Tax=Notolabrus celidotus TaxID=1203425 RepID=UPI00148F7221|nr:C-type lectin domain family 7 member A-like [Notolabrus celidotus]